MTAYFGANHTGEEDDPWDFVNAAPEIPHPLPLTDTDTEEGDTKSISSIQSASLPLGSPSVKEPSPKEPYIRSQP